MKYSLQRPSRTLSLDGMQPKTLPRHQATTAAAKKSATNLSPPRRPFALAGGVTLPQKRSRWQLPSWMQLMLAFPLLLVAAFSIQSPILGQVLIVAYGVVAFMRHIPSRTTFTLAFVAMIATTILLVIRGNLLMAQNFATYTFLLLVVGVFTLSRELKREGGRIYSSKYTQIRK